MSSNRVHPVALALAAFAVGLLVSTFSHAEETTATAPPVTGGYAGPEMKVSTLAGDAVLLAGGQAGWILADSIVIGGAGYATVTDVIPPLSLQAPGGNARLGLGYGGVRMGGILAPKQRVHGAFGLLIGGGMAYSATRDESFRRHDRFVVVEPAVEVEANVVRHVRVALGGGYRFVGNTEEPGFLPMRLSGPSAMLVFRFGEL
ncbi:MAG: hypothetical protein KIT84_16305 [Labilithrix sp.]|nr:hypothetical protein [Labilithrix sp.]MCW5812592.1 hypothetical protein [Labilithrix sp.]